MPVKVAFDADGKPTPALLKRKLGTKKCGVQEIGRARNSIAERASDGKARVFIWIAPWRRASTLAAGSAKCA